jgi:uncharacterized protein YneF (UPF0154 family)
MDLVAVIIAVFGLLGGLIAFVSFISQRPTRDEMNDAIDKSVTPISEDLKYVRDRIDAMFDMMQKKDSQ